MSKLLLYLKSDTFKKNLIAALIAVVLLFAGIYFGLRSYTKHGESIAVPVVKGMHIDEAVRLLDQADLEYKVDSVYQLDAPPGQVIDQDPEAQSHVKTGRTIYLTMITRTPPDVAFPNVIDKTLIEASAIIQNQSLKISDTIYVPDIARDVVLDVKFAGQPLKAGQMIPKGSNITVVLGDGRGNEDVEVPNLIGLSLSEARFALSGVGLSLGNVQYDANTLDSLSATVTIQQPSVSTGYVTIGSAIDITLSN